jgi:hypothetical protein
MWRLLRTIFHKLNLRRYHRRIKRALALHLRGEARKDGLKVDNVSSRLEIRWRARDIHPWDRHLARYEREVMFAEQALTDTEAAVGRLFEKLPEIDVIELSVLEPTSETLIAAGTVHRSDLNTVRPRLLSVGMRLREVGVKYRFATSEKGDPTENVPVGDLCARWSPMQCAGLF